MSSFYYLDQQYFSIQDEQILQNIIAQIPYPQVFLTQILFAIEQSHELIQATQDYHVITNEHQGRVGRLAAILAQYLKLPWYIQLECLIGGWIHDIGKIHVDINILNKPTGLTKEEYEQMKLHVQYSATILANYPHLHIYSSPILYHHEKWDGTGYPYNLSCSEIPLTGRITGLVDAYDAMTSLRPYANQMSHEQAVMEIKRCAGTQFDNNLAKAFCKIPKKIIMQQCTKEKLTNKL